MLKYIVFVLTSFMPIRAACQDMAALADSLRLAYKIPAVSYAVISADSVFEVQALGVRKINTQLKATLSNRYRIGSNTKAITGFIAMQLVKQGKISWDTKFFDLFPELKAGSRKEYHQMTLLNLLSFRTKLFPYTYTDREPAIDQFKGDEEALRYQFAQWFLKHEPVHKRDSVCFSNLGYVAAGMMLEKATGKPHKQLVTELGIQLNIDFQFGQPNVADSDQIWGHDAALKPEAPANNYKLNWLLAAGNINMTMPDYIKYIQLQLKGLSGKSQILTQDEFHFLHYGLRQFALGWFWEVDDKKRQFSYNVGNPGTFLTKVYIFHGIDRAFILFTNAQTEGADTGTEILLSRLVAKYGS